MEALEEKPITGLELKQLTEGRQHFPINQVIGQPPLKQGVTFWEQLTCVGYQPDQERLTAIFQIKRDSGYSGPLCSQASFEHVRFFVDFGGGFKDMGYVSTKVADIPGTSTSKPLTYSVQLTIDDEKYRKALDCDQAVIPTVRAVLSWHTVPSSDPDKIPVYGNRIDRKIQLKRKSSFVLSELLQSKQITIHSELLKAINLQASLQTVFTKMPLLSELLKKNAAADVPTHRTLFNVAVAMTKPAKLAANATLFDIHEIIQAGINLNDIAGLILKDPNKADVSFEELLCVGFNTAADTLSAVVRIKKKSGFNGSLCSAGSKEYVAFWADWDNNDTFEHYVGTTSFDAFDIKNIPADGLDYAITMPLNVENRLKLCKTPQTIRIRAVLSWQTLPSTTDPNDLNYWGNRRDATVQLRPNSAAQGKVGAVITYVGGVPRTSIDPTAFLYNYRTINPTSDNNRPWGGAVVLNGIIDRNGFGGDVFYKLLVKPTSAPDSAYALASTNESIWMYNFGTASYSTDPQSPADGWFIYRQNPAAGIYNVNNVFATFQSGSRPDGDYTLKFLIREGLAGVEQTSDTFTLKLCNTHMTVSLTANTAVDTDYTVDLVIDGGDCHSYSPNEPTLNGHVRAIHPFFAGWSLRLEPQSHVPEVPPGSGNKLAPAPANRYYTALGDTGDANGSWSLDTFPLKPCGYTVSLLAYTRVILNSSPGNLPQYGPKAIGFAKLP